jgi:hypothetical protein
MYEGSARQTQGRAQRFLTEYPARLRHTLLEVPDHGRLGSRDRDCECFAGRRLELNDLKAKGPSRRADRSGDLLPPSPPAEKATARQDQAGKSSASDGGGDTTDGGCRIRIVVSLKATARRVVDSAAQDKLSDDLPRAGMDVEIVCGLIGLIDAKNEPRRVEPSYTSSLLKKSGVPQAKPT